MIKGTTRYFRYSTYIPTFIKGRFVRDYGAIVFTIFTMIIFIVFAIKPTLETIFVLQKKEEDANKVLQRLDQKTNDLTLAIKNFENLNESIKNKIQLAIPNSVTIKTITSSLEDTALENDASISALQLQSITLEPKKVTDYWVENLSEVEFTFNIAGSYPQIVSVLAGLKSEARLITINSVSFHSTEEEKNQGLVMSISGKAYFIK